MTNVIILPADQPGLFHVITPYGVILNISKQGALAIQRAYRYPKH